LTGGTGDSRDQRVQKKAGKIKSRRIREGSINITRGIRNYIIEIRDSDSISSVGISRRGSDIRSIIRGSIVERVIISISTKYFSKIIIRVIVSIIIIIIVSRM